ncbi:MAG: DUF2182 domain-containing protein [Acetobacteraceae bacterium]|nr:DUF2182 domain-containing protein [Acetobacteraceae bacterium]
MKAAVAALAAMSRGDQWPLLPCSFAAWAALTGLEYGSSSAPQLCFVAPTQPSPGEIGLRLAAELQQVGAGSLLCGWTLMLCAMMLPLLWPQLQHLRARSLRARRSRATALFLAGYAVVWLPVLAAIWAVSIALRPLLFAASVGILLLWQRSAWRARALRRCHELPTLPVFGVAAEWASLRFGVRTGAWCAASCWALMLTAGSAPMLSVPAMAVAAAFALSDRYARPPLPRRRTLPPGHWREEGDYVRSRLKLL